MLPVFILLLVLVSAQQESVLPSDSCQAVLSPDPPLLGIPLPAPDIFRLDLSAIFPQSQRNTSASAPATQPVSRILNGQLVASPTLMQHLAVIIVFNLQTIEAVQLCAASVIAPAWLLTSSLCLLSPSNATVVVGSRRVFSGFGWVSEGGSQISIERTIVHPLSSPEQPSIVLVQLERPVPQPMLFMKLNPSNNEPRQGSFLRFAGYGTTISLGTDQNDNIFRLRQVDLPTAPQETCNAAFEEQFNADRHFCAGYSNRWCGPCLLDTGGPVFQYDSDNNIVQFGILIRLSRGSGLCGEAGFPSLFIRVSTLLDWIQEQGIAIARSSEVEPVFASGSQLPMMEQVGSSKTGAIVGGVVGGVSLVIMLFTLWKFIWGKANRGIANDMHVGGDANHEQVAAARRPIFLAHWVRYRRPETPAEDTFIGAWSDGLADHEYVIEN